MRERTKHRKSRKRQIKKEGSQVSQSHWFLVLVAMKICSPDLLLWGAKLADSSSCFPSGCTTMLVSKPPSHRLPPDNDCALQDWNTGYSCKTRDSLAWKLWSKDLTYPRHSWNCTAVQGSSCPIVFPSSSPTYVPGMHYGPEALPVFCSSLPYSSYGHFLH